MHIEAFVDIETLRKVVDQSAPIRLLLGDERWVELADPTDVELRDGKLHLICNGRFQWTALDVPVSFEIRHLRAVFALRVVSGSKIALGVAFEDVEIAHIPSMVERHMMRKVNDALVPERTGLIWSVRDALRYMIQVPERVPTHEEFRLEPGELTLEINDTGVCFRVSLAANLFRALERTKMGLRLASDAVPSTESASAVDGGETSTADGVAANGGSDVEEDPAREPSDGEEPRAIRFIF